MKETVRIVFPLAILAVGVLGFMTFGKPATPATNVATTQKAPLVLTQEVQLASEGFTLEVEGVATTYREIRLSAEVSGRIVEKGKNSRAGSYVRAGDLLFRIDETDYLLDVERLTTQLRQADEDLAAVDIDLSSTRSLILLAQEDVDIKKRELKRRLDLQERSAGSHSALDEARTFELSARNLLLGHRNQIASLEQRKRTLSAARDLVLNHKKTAEVNAERTRVSSPINGLVILDSVEENDYVKVGDLLIHLNDTGKMEVKCNLRLEELFWIWDQAHVLTAPSDMARNRLEIPETKVQVAFTRNGQESIWEGVLSRYEGTGVDQETRTVPCRVRVDEPTQIRNEGEQAPGRKASLPTLFSGMYVKIRIPINPEEPLLQVPDLAVRPGNEVWTVKNGSLKIQKIAIARVEGSRVLAHPTSSGLSPGDRLVTSPLSAAYDGMAVEEDTP